MIRLVMVASLESRSECAAPSRPVAPEELVGLVDRWCYRMNELHDGQIGWVRRLVSTVMLLAIGLE